MLELTFFAFSLSNEGTGFFTELRKTYKLSGLDPSDFRGTHFHLDHQNQMWRVEISYGVRTGCHGISVGLKPITPLKTLPNHQRARNREADAKVMASHLVPVTLTGIK